MNIWYLNHYASPPGWGRKGRPYFIGKNLSKLGANVVVFCASHHHLRKPATLRPDRPDILQTPEATFVQIPARPYHMNGITRLLNMSDFVLKTARFSSGLQDRLRERPDVVVASCAHIFSYLAGRTLAKRFNAGLVYEVRDLWPLSLVEISGFSGFHPLIVMMAMIEKHAYRNCDAVISLLPNAMDYMVSKGLPAERFTYIPNGAEPTVDNPVSAKLPENHLRAIEAIKRKGKTIVMYAGSHGPPNALDQVLALKKVSGENPAYHFVLIGEGVSKADMMKQAEENSISFVTFLPPIPSESVPAALALSDMCFLGWHEKPIYRFGISPNKIADYFFAGKPVVHAVCAGNDPVAESGAGISVPPFAPDKLHEAVMKIATMPDTQRQQMGEKGRRFAMENLNWKTLGIRYYHTLQAVLQRRGN